jgi:hypothetical protein
MVAASKRREDSDSSSGSSSKEAEAKAKRRWKWKEEWGHRYDYSLGGGSERRERPSALRNKLCSPAIQHKP